MVLWISWDDVCLSQTSNCMRTWSLRVLRQSLRLALSALHVLAAAASATFKSRAALHLENLALRHQLGVLQRSVKRPKLTVGRSTPLGVAVRGLERLAICPGHRQAGNRHCLAPQGLPSVLDLEGPARPARPAGGPEGRSRTDPQDEPRESALGRTPRSTANCSNSASTSARPAWASTWCGRRKPPSQTWRTFLENHVKTMVSVDFFTVPTIRFQVLYVFLVLAHDRRRIVHFNVTAHPTAEWTAQQLREAFPFDQIPRYLLRDRDGIFGGEFRKDVKAMGIKEVLSAPRSPWQRAYVERVIGTIRRECLDHVIVFNEASLYRHVKSFVAYYHESRTHLSLAKDAPEPRPVQPPELGRIVAIPQVGGLHHRYERRAA